MTRTDGSGGADPRRVALSFIAAVREDPALRESVASLVSAEDGLEAIVNLAVRSGYAIGVEDLRAAFAMDWGLRRALSLRESSS